MTGERVIKGVGGSRMLRPLGLLREKQGREARTVGLEEGVERAAERGAGSVCMAVLTKVGCFEVSESSRFSSSAIRTLASSSSVIVRRLLMSSAACGGG